MGLLSHMEAILASDSSTLDAGSMVDSSQKQKIEDYHSFSKRTALKQSAVLVPFGRRFFMRYEHGFDVETIFKSISSVDFWNGTIPLNQQWHSFSGNELEPFYQLFSKDCIHNLTNLHIKSFILLADIPIQAIMIIADETINQELVDDTIPELADYIAAEILNTIEIIPPTPLQVGSRSFSVSIKDAVAEITDLLYIDTEALDLLFPVVLSETLNRLQQILSKQDIVFPLNDFDIALFFSHADNIDADLLQFQLKKYFVPLLGTSSSKILVESVQS